MDRLTRSVLGTFAISAVLASAAALAIVAFHAPFWLLVLEAWGGAMAYGVLRSWLDRRPRRR